MKDDYILLHGDEHKVVAREAEWIMYRNVMGGTSVTTQAEIDAQDPIAICEAKKQQAWDKMTHAKEEFNKWEKRLEELNNAKQ